MFWNRKEDQNPNNSNRVEVHLMSSLKNISRYPFGYLLSSDLVLHSFDIVKKQASNISSQATSVSNATEEFSSTIQEISRRVSEIDSRVRYVLSGVINYEKDLDRKGQSDYR